MKLFKQNILDRRDFIKKLSSGMFISLMNPLSQIAKDAPTQLNDIYWIKDIPEQPFYSKENINCHAGLDSLLYLMGEKGLKLYRSAHKTVLSGPLGLIGPEDVVLLKVNAQWKYRGCTNSDLIRGLIQRILEHPDIFTGEIVIFDNGQGSGSLNSDTNKRSVYPDESVHANANNEKHSFQYLVDEVFSEPRVSSYLLDPLNVSFIDDDDHTSDGYKRYQNVSYPCFTTEGGHRIELKNGIWNGNGYDQNLRLINVPVLKHHSGSHVTASLKNFYGVLSMYDGYSRYRHYSGLGRTCGKMVVSVCTPVLNILDAIWVSHATLTGYPEDKCVRTNQIIASQDPVALDYWAAKHILYPIRYHPWHHPEHPETNMWLAEARSIINERGGLADSEKGIIVDKATIKQEEMHVFSRQVGLWNVEGKVILGESSGSLMKGEGLSGVTLNGLPGGPITDHLGNFSASVVNSWRERIKPEKEDYFFQPESQQLTKMKSDRDLKVFTALRIIYSPINFRGEKVLNRSLSQGEYINVLKWLPNERNEFISRYRIYRVDGTDQNLLAELDADKHEYWHRYVERNKKYVYKLISLNDHGREGIPAYLTVK